MQFWDTWQELEELYKTDFKDGSDTNYYHFYTSLADLISSLAMKRIFSNKNEQTSQLDLKAYNDNTAYVCMTIGKEGKNRAAYSFNGRCFGLSFKDLPGLCARSYGKYIFDTETAYSQFAQKTQYDRLKRGSEVKGNPTQSNKDKKIAAFRDFELLAIGELAGEYAGYYFISGGQGRTLGSKGTKHWNSKLFTEADFPGLYKTLSDWFKANMNNMNPGTAQPHSYYHFKDNEIGTPTAVFNRRPINTSAQLNKNYIPWHDKKQKHDKYTHYSAMNFTLNKGAIPFKEILGIGPFMVTDQVGNVLLKMDMVNPSAQGGYQPPKLFGADSTTQQFSDETRHTTGKKTRVSIGDTQTKNRKSDPLNLLMSHEVADAMAALYNESEYRIYIKNKRDFAFNQRDLASITLPAKLAIASEATINFVALVDALSDTNSPISTFTACHNKHEDLVSVLRQCGIIMADETPKYLTCTRLAQLIELLQTDYADITVELIGDLSATANAAETSYAKYGTPDTLPKPSQKSAKIQGLTGLRYVVDHDPTDIIETRPHRWKNKPMVLGKLGIVGEEEARLGSQVLLLGQDMQKNKYILFVTKEHLSVGFFELPGGGLIDHLNVTDGQFECIAKQRLHMKGGIEKEYIVDFTDTNKALLLDESVTAQDKSIKWPWSYYKLYSARYAKPIQEDDIDYNFDNRTLSSEIRGTDEHGYICYLKWIPIDHIDKIDGVVRRYSNILNDIKNLAKRL